MMCFHFQMMKPRKGQRDGVLLDRREGRRQMLAQSVKRFDSSTCDCFGSRPSAIYAVWRYFCTCNISLTPDGTVSGDINEI